MNDDDQYRASNYLKKDDDSQYLASNYLKDKKEEKPSLLERAGKRAADFNATIEAGGRFGANAAAGLGQSIANIPAGLWNLAASGNNALGGNTPKAPMIDVVPHGAGKTLGDILSFVVANPLLKLGAQAPHVATTLNSMSKVPVIANAIKHASNVLTKNPTASSVVGNAILGGAMSPDNQLTGVALGGAAPLVGKGINKAINTLRPSNLFRGNLSPEELQNNLRVTRGTETGLGDVIGSPYLKRLNENILSKIPFSGVNESMQRNAGNIIEQGHGLMRQLQPKGNVGDIDQHINNALKSSYNSHNAVKNALYNNSNKIADESGFKLDLPTFSETAKKYKKALEDTTMLQYEPEAKTLLQKLGVYENPVKSETSVSKIVDEKGRPITSEKVTTPTLKEANLLKGKLNTLASQYGASPNPSDRGLAKVFGELASVLKGDITGAIEKSGNKELMAANKLAEENYAKKFSPFLDKEIYKYAHGNADPETLVQSFIKTGKASDRAGLIKRLVDKLPANQKNSLGFAYLQRAMDDNNVLNPMKLRTLLGRNSIGPKQFAALFPDVKMRNALTDYMQLVDKNTKALKIMQNPDTGQMNMDILPLLSKSPMGLVGKMMGAPVVAKALRSEKTRNSLVNKMIEKK